MTSNPATSYIPDWQKLSGLTLDGGYELQEVLEADAERAVVKVRVLGDSLLKASARFYVLEDSIADQQLQVWQRLQMLRNAPGLSLPLGSGKMVLGKVPTTYIVLRNPDESLADGLADRALGKDEAREVMQSIARGLEALHASGLGHGRVSPEEVLAAGNSIVLSSEFARDLNSKPALEPDPPKYLAPESPGHNTTAAADVWCAGATIFEALTRKRYEPALQAEAGQLPEPFGTLAARCLEVDPEARLKPGEARALLEGRLPLARAARAAAQEPVRPAGPMPAAGIVDLAAATRPAPRAEVSSQRPIEPAHPEIVTEASPRRRLWWYAVGIGVLLILVVWLSRSRQASPTISQPIQPSAQTGGPPAAATTTPQTSSAPAQTPSSAPPQPAASASAPATASTASHVRNSSAGPVIWRVILFTYNREADAQKKARSLNDRFSQLGAQVFSPSGHGGPYLVTAGGRMTYDEARAARQKLIRAGMPRDTYVQNYR